MPDIEASIQKNLKHNVMVNLLDGAFFGAGWGFGSFGTMIPLFISRMTDSALLIGLIPAIHAVGWQLPQLFMAGAVSRLRRYKPMVMWITIHERLPFLGLTLIAFFTGAMGNKTILLLTFLLLIWQGLGAGFTANAWQTMLAKIIPPTNRGTFFGAQSALVNIFISISAIGAGYLLDWLDDGIDFGVAFLITLAGMGLSMIAIGMTREPEDLGKTIPEKSASPWRGWLEILRKDRNFSAFLVVRILSQFSMMGFAFYIVFGLHRFAMDAVTAGFLTAVLTITQTAGSLVMGWLGDRLGHRSMLITGSIAVVCSSLLAWGAQGITWLYPVVILSGLANVAYWTIGIAITAEFGREETRPIYIGLSNTLVAPFAIMAPLIGGWITDAYSFQATFMVSAIGGIIVTFLLFWLVRDPQSHRHNHPREV